MSLRRSVYMLTLLVALTSVLVACASSPTVVEVTREVISEVQVTVEVTRVVTEQVPVEITVEVPVEVEVEVTRIVEVEVEVPVTATPAAEAAAATPAPTLQPTTAAAVAATAVPVSGARYTVQQGDTLSRIAATTGVSAEAIMAANNLSNANVIVAGQELIIPGWSGETAVAPPTQPGQPTRPASANLLPNPSFEANWYFFNGVSEWQLPDNWLLSVDEGPNTLSPSSGGNFLRPEVRLLTNTDLPPGERERFVFDGIKTIKAFKGDAPTNFAIFTDVFLPVGRYRFTSNFFPDTVLAYDGGTKIWNQDPLAAEYRIIVNNGGSGWNAATVGVQNTRSYEFTISEAQTVRIGTAFRNRFAGSNNGWFIDDWSLEAIGSQ